MTLHYQSTRKIREARFSFRFLTPEETLVVTERSFRQILVFSNAVSGQPRYGMMEIMKQREVAREVMFEIDCLYVSTEMILSRRFREFRVRNRFGGTACFT